MPKFNDLMGKTFGRWTVLSLHCKRCVVDGVNIKTKWMCICECGTVRPVESSSLLNGKSPSCGCLTGDRVRTHGMSNHPLYDIWSGIRSRVLNPSDDAYDRYGGRGIGMEPEWVESPSAFIAWVEAELGEKPSKSHSIDRVDNSGGYFKDNVRWADSYAQGSNKRNNRLMTHAGITLTLSQWARVIGVNRTTLRQRLDVLGWSPERALAHEMLTQQAEVFT